VPVTPSRLLDTREGNGAPKAPLGGGQTMHLQVTGRGGVPSSKVSAVVLNMTVTGPTSAGYLTVYPTGIPRPTASNLNFPAGWTGANSVTVPVGANGQVDIFNAAGNVHASTFTGTGTKTVTAPPAVAGDNTYALVTNVTGVDPANSTYLSLWATGDTQPTVSNLNLTPHEVRPNAAFVPVGPGNKFNVFNAAWKVDVVIDVSGTFEFLPGSVPAAQAASLARQAPLHVSSTGTPQRQTLQ